MVLIAPYVELEVDVLKLVMLSKEISKQIWQEVYKECLLRGTGEAEHIKRMQIWNVLLPLHVGREVNYFEMRDKINRENIDFKDKDVIKLDVDRSFTNILKSTLGRGSHVSEKDLWRFQEEFFEINKTSLLNILNTFAYVTPRIGYCQGMNFLAGFFLLFYKSEEKAFYALIRLCDQFQLEPILNLRL